MIVEDVVTSGASVLETSSSLLEEGLKVTDAVVLLDREQGGPERIATGGVKLRAALTVSTFIAVLEKSGKLDTATADRVRKFVADNRFGATQTVAGAAPAAPVAKKSYGERASLTENVLAKKLLALMEEKKTNLSVAADLGTCAEVLALADAIGPHVCVFKTHVDVLSDFTPEFGQKLLALAEKHNFFIFEDRKFADIGNTVAMQYGGGVYRIADWSHITNAHTVPGPGIIDGLAQVGLAKGLGLLLLGEMSSAGTLAEGEYTKKTVEMAKARKDFCMGSANPFPRPAGAWEMEAAS
jgi:uridine monophosphate synthetase